MEGEPNRYQGKREPIHDIQMMKKLLFIPILFLCVLANAQEVITSYSQGTLSTLNEELRKTYESLDDLSSRVTEVANAEFSFLSLTDTPSSYEGMAGLVPTVSDDEDAVEFKAVERVFIFTTPGTYTWTCPPGITRVAVTMVGGGGGGGAGHSGGGTTNGSSGGAMGGYVYREIVAVTPGTSYTVVVGAAGVGGTAPDGNGTAGGSSSFTADSGTVTAAGGARGVAHSTSTTTGGSVTGYSIFLSDPIASATFWWKTNMVGTFSTTDGSGTTGGGSLELGHYGSGASGAAGTGGDHGVGGGGGGSTWGKGGTGGAAAGAGSDATGRGAGGGGAGDDGGDGGDGSPGIVMLEA